jgi:hypothetical protein
MTGNWRLGGLIAVLAAWAASASAQKELSLASLTVPEKNLPNGCRLRPHSPQSSFPFPNNPWVGRDRKLLVELRRNIDGPLRLPDAPPLSAKEVSTFERQWVADVVEGYRAVYISAETILVRVSAIRFDSGKVPAHSPPASAAGLQGVKDRLVVGPAIVQISADSPNECFQAVDRHIRALK